MVSALLIFCLLVAAVPVWGGVPLQLCRSCHPGHYPERGGCRDCHHGNPASARKNIAHAGLRGGKYLLFTLGDVAVMRDGERLLDQLACRRCHVTAGRGNRLAVSLDGAVSRKTTGELVTAIRRPVASMPDFGLDEGQITKLVNVLYAGAEGRHTDAAAPVRVHFNNSGKKNEDIFSKKCGGCHRTVSERLGAVGTGAVGPNLSGLFSEYYPKTFRSGEAWNARNLRVWLENPRKIKQWTRMQPVPLTEPERKELETFFAVSTAAKK